MTLCISDFGAVADGRTCNTRAIQAALDAAAASGDGRVVVPPGRFLTGTIFVRDQVTLELAANAVLLGSPRWEDYPPIEYESRPQRHLVVVKDVRNAGVEGRGTVDGGGAAFWEPATDPHRWIRAKPQRPGAMLAVINSQDILLRDFRLTQPPNWACDLYGSDRVSVRGVSIVNDHLTPNNDGIDISGSHDVVISDCFIDTGDDGIVINARPRDVRRVAVTNCTIRSECAALKVGWEYTRHDIRQVAFSNCVVFGSNRGVAFYTGNGAVLEDIVVSNIVFDSNVPVILARPIHMDLRRGRDTKTFGAIRHVLISNFVARTQGRILLTAEEGGRLEDIVLRDVELVYPYVEDPAPWAKDATSSQFSNTNPAARMARAAVVAENIRGLCVENLSITWPSGPVPGEWRLPVKRENGGDRLFRPDYGQALPVDFAALWGRHVSGSVSARRAAPSSAAAQKYDLQDCDLRIAD